MEVVGGGRSEQREGRSGPANNNSKGRTVIKKLQFHRLRKEAQGSGEERQSQVLFTFRERRVTLASVLPRPLGVAVGALLQGFHRMAVCVGWSELRWPRELKSRILLKTIFAG